MKKLLLTILLISSAAYSDAIDNRSKWNIGIQGGLNASFKYDDSDWNNRLGYNFGAFANYDLSPLLFIRGGFGYSTKGATYKESNNHIKSKTAREVGYLHAPLYVGMRLKATENLSFNSLSGGYLAYGINFKNTYTEGGEKTVTKGQKNTYIRKGDFGFVIGAEAEYKNFILSLTYEFGFRNIALEGSSSPSYKSWKNRNGGINLCYQFEL